MGPMYTSERAQYSKGYRAAELCRNLAEELGNDRGEDRDRFLLQTSGFCGRLMAGNNHTGTASCPGAARRATDAFAALLRLLQQHAAYAVLEAP